MKKFPAGNFARRGEPLRKIDLINVPCPDVPLRAFNGGDKFDAGGRTWEILHTPGHSPGHICIWSAEDGLLCSGDHLLKSISPPVTFERGFERDPMGSYLESLRLVELLEPALVLPGHGETFTDGARTNYDLVLA